MTNFPLFPLDFSVFREMRLKKYLYVDKTAYLHRMLTKGRNYFLARPRRFGKSLLVSTLESILKGEKELFEELWISKSDYNWQPYGVINLDFSSRKSQTAENWEKGICSSLKNIAREYGIEQLLIIENPSDPTDVFAALVNVLYEKYGQVALLIDEYDSPILHNLADSVLAESITKSLREFFMAVKSLGNKITFSFTTGISSFARTGFFSGMNNLRVLTLEREYAAICGYTEKEVDSYFSSYIQEWATKEAVSETQIKQQLKEWYNGYCFGHEVQTVYNPFSLMHALEKKEFRNFWFETGNPTFLVEELEKRKKAGENLLVAPETVRASEQFLGTFKIQTTPLLSLLFQTGYVTITGFDSLKRFYSLDYPNYEVRSAFQTHLLSVLASIETLTAEGVARDMEVALKQQDISGFIQALKSLFAQIPYHLHIEKESFYHALLQIALGAAGFKAQSEYATDQGRIDLIVDTTFAVYIIEVKLDSSAKTALAQIKDKKYYERFLPDKKQIILIGICFEKAAGKFDISYKTEILAANVR